MRIIRHLNVLKGHSLVVALGTFDGVHRGHQKVIGLAKDYARRNKCELAVIAFDPHPQQVVAPERGLRILTQVSEKASRMEDLGVDYLILLKFDRNLRSLSYKQFVEKYLVHLLKAKAVFVGYDHAFGKGRQGNVNELKKLGKKYGFAVTVVSPVLSRFRPIKSSLIREEISGGNFNWAVDLLGHPYIVSGLIRKGFGQGRKLGFPTVNLKVTKDKLVPAHGIYAGWAVVNDKRYPAAIYIGSRPTFPEKTVAIEAHFIDSKLSPEQIRATAHGNKVNLELVRWIRGDKQFADVEALKKAIRTDIDYCKRALKA
jgi:riboflavin kinase/FMN adenylyltransferase